MPVGMEGTGLENNCLKSEEHRLEYKDSNRLKEIRMEIRTNISSMTNPEKRHSTRSTITGQESQIRDG